MPCKPFEEYAAAYANKLSGHALRELPQDAVQRFNARPPPTDYHQVWLMDILDGFGMIFAGPGNDQACMIGILEPNNYQKARDDLEGGKT